MMDKKLITLLVAIATVGSISARCYEDKNGQMQCTGPVRRTVRGTGRFVGNVVTLGGVSRHERREQQRRNQEEAQEEEEYSNNEDME